MDICSDNRFKIIEKAKKHLLESTNIECREDEMKVLDNILFRCWQMGWLDRYDDSKKVVDENKLVELAINESPELQMEECYSTWVKGFKVGYRKAMEE